MSKLGFLWSLPSLITFITGLTLLFMGDFYWAAWMGTLFCLSNIMLITHFHFNEIFRGKKGKEG
jgi:hypothetical protein